MRRFLLFSFCFILFTGALAQNKDTAAVSITNFKLHPGTFSWRVPGNVGTYFDMTSWDSSPYTEGHLKQGSSFRMNYRLLYPLSHNPSYQPGYPLIVMLHGAGERANCWNGQCYFGTTGYSPNAEPVGATQDQLNNLMNNDHNLVHGGFPHLTARNLAAGKLPDDPTLHPQAFPGFVLFPQMMNGWDGQYEHAIRIIRLLVKQLNIDPNRIYIHGLSNGGHGVLNTVRTADWLFAASAPMSAIPSHSDFRAEVLGDSLTHIPFWFFQGGQDGNPFPWYTEETIRRMKASGLSVRYTLYPSLGHGVWNNAYAEPDFFSWLLSHNKSDIHVYYGNPTICGTTGEGAKLGLAQGFPAYQWERDGVVIPGATTYQYIATIPGIYRARFSRIPNPSESQWNIWSKPVTVTEVMRGKASIEVIGSTHLRGPDNINDSTHNSVTIRSAEPDDNYYWYRNGVLIDIPYNLQDDSVRNFTLMRTSSSYNGAYTLRTAGFDNCPTVDSDPVYLFFNNSQTTAISSSVIPNTFTGTALSSSSILLRWNDRSAVERGFEIYRRKFGQPPFDFVKRTAEDAVQFIDTNLEPNTTYEYKIRLVNNQGKSIWYPAGNPLDLNTNLVVTTLGDNVKPGPPQNLTAIASGNRKITLSWTPPADQDIDHYFIYFGSDSIQVEAPTSTHTFSGLQLNSTFNYTVRAVDHSGKFSDASNQATANTYVTGLFYKHSTGAWSTLNDPTMQATFASPEFTGVVPNFTLAPRTQEDFFNFEFEGYINITQQANYQFRTTSDDGSRLWIDGVQIIDNDGLHGNVSVTSASIPLSPGPHEIRVQYFENGGGQSLEVRWRGGNSGASLMQNPILIPDSRLRSGTPPAPPVPPVAPTNLSATPVSMTGIDLDWDFTGQNPEGLKIVVLGSSTAEGIIGPTSVANSWVGRLTSWLASTTTGSSVNNRGLGGFDTYDVRATGSTNPAPDVTRNITYALAQNPHIILVNLPTNDVANDIPLATTMANFRGIKALADARGIPMFITTSQPRNFSTQDDRDLLEATADSIRAAFGSYVIDIYDELTDFSNGKTIKPIYKYSGDGIHLNDDGHNYIFEQTRNKLMAYLNRFELQRAQTVSGPFTTIATRTTTEFNDTGLQSNTEYFYRVRTVNVNGNSPYTTVVSATTMNDNVPPSQPTTLTAPTKTMTSIALSWTASTDNVGVTGYQIWANGIMLGTSEYPTYMLSNLNPGTLYAIYVVAYDGQGNLSIPSVTLSGPTTTTTGSTLYFSRSTGLLNDLSTWTTSANGVGGSSPASFVANGNIFNVSNRTATGLGGSLAVEGATSKVVVKSGVTLNVDNALNARVEVEGTGVVNLNYADQTPQLLTLSGTSTVNYNYVDDVVFIQQKSYGNLGLNGAGLKSFPSGNTTVLGNLSVGAGVGLKGEFGNLTTIDLTGDLAYSGTPAFVAPENAVTLNMNRNGVQNVTTSGTLDLFRILTASSTTVNVSNGGSANTLRFGSPNGGGLQLANGSIFNLGSNNLSLIGNAVVNANDETGRIGVNQGQIAITSGSNTSSNFYFDASNRTLSRLTVNLTGAGVANIRSSVQVSDGIKITAGTISSAGNITLLSTLNQTANLEQIENNGQITGDVTVQRYIHAKGRIYRYLSSPVAGQTVADWQTYIPVTGPFTGASTGSGLGTTSSMFYYGNDVWVPYPAAGNNEPIERGRGYSIFVRNTATATLMQPRGVPYQGEIPFDINPATPGNPESGWNLLGNPYASTIAWNLDNNQWPRTGGISTVVNVRQNNADSLGTNQFRYYDALTGTGNLAGGRIAPGQAFWIQSTTADADLAIRESAKRTAQHFLFRESTPSVPRLTLTLSQGSKSDETFIVLTPQGSDSFDPIYDGVKRANEGIFNFSTMPENSNVSLAINNASNTFCSKSIALNLQNVTPGNYNISAADIADLAGVGSVRLIDKVTNSTTDLRHASYNFAVTAESNTFGPNRFIVTFDRPDLDLEIITSATDACGASAQITLHNSQPGATYTLLNYKDEVVSAEVVGDGEDQIINIDQRHLASGQNSFKVRAGFDGCSPRFLTRNATVTYSIPQVPEVSAISVCPGTNGTLTVTNNIAGATYTWFTPSGEKIKGISGPVFVTGPLFEATDYGVSISVNGCPGPLRFVPIEVPQVSTPVAKIEGKNVIVTGGGAIQWFKDGTPLFNENRATLTPRSAGVYTAVVSRSGCELTSNPIVWDMQTEAIVYPNPGTADQLHLLFRSQEDGPVRVVVSDILGRVHVDQHFDVTVLFEGAKLPTRNRLNSGVYFVQFTQNGTTQKVRFVVQ